MMPSTFRGRDKLYMLFLMSYILAIVFLDALPFYPPSLVPAPLLSTRDWYKTYFNDQLVITQPPWFRFFALAEFLYELPVAIWGIWALSTKSPKAPAHLLVWSVVCAGTTFTCLFEIYHNSGMSGQEKTRLFALYGSYGFIFSLLGTDMFCRIQKTLLATTLPGKEIKQQ